VRRPVHAQGKSSHDRAVYIALVIVRSGGRGWPVVTRRPKSPLTFGRRSTGA
jgi:hypothetical protein